MLFLIHLQITNQSQEAELSEIKQVGMGNVRAGNESLTRPCAFLGCFNTCAGGQPIHYMLPTLLNFENKRTSQTNMLLLHKVLKERAR